MKAEAKQIGERAGLTLMRKRVAIHLFDEGQSARIEFKEFLLSPNGETVPGTEQVKNLVISNVPEQVQSKPVFNEDGDRVIENGEPKSKTVVIEEAKPYFTNFIACVADGTLSDKTNEMIGKLSANCQAHLVNPEEIFE